MSKRLACLSAVVGAILLAGSARAVILTDFESASGFTAGSSIDGIGGWAVLAGGGDVTPGGTYTKVLAGQQSAAMHGSTVWATDRFPLSAPLADGSTVSYLLSVTGTSGSADTYLTHNIAGLSTPVGVLAPVGADFQLFGGSTSGGSPLAVVAGHDYKVEMVTDFTAGNIQAYATDLTAGSARTGLGMATFATPFTPDQVLNSGGLFIITSVRDNAGDVGTAAAVYDNIAVDPVPEPAGLAMLAMGALALARRRHG